MKKIFTILIASIACVLYLASCIDNAYDLDKDINQEINVGGDYLSLPIGTTDSIFLSELFDFEEDDEFIQALENGDYSILYKDSVDIKGIKIDPVSIGKIAPSIPAIDIPRPNIPSFNSDRELEQTKFAVKFKIPEGEGGLSAKIEINEEIPSEIEKLISVDMGGESGVALEVSIEFTLPIGFDEVILDTFAVDFPNIFKFKEELEAAGDNRIKFVSNDTLKGVDGIFTFEKTFYLTSLELGDVNLNVVDGEDGKKYFTLDDNINITGGIIVPVDMVLPPQLDKITCTPAVILNTMDFSKVTGVFNPDIEPINEAFVFDGLPDFLQGDDVKLDFVNPVIKFKVSNTLDIPMIANADIAPMIGGISKEGVAVALNVVGTEDPNMPALSKFWLSEITTGMPESWIYVDAKVGSLLEKIPDSLSIKIDVETAKDKGSHSIDLNESYDLNVNYAVDVPLALGDEFKINYSDTIKDIGEDLEDVIDKIESLSLDIEATNSVPLNMSIDFIPKDKEFGGVDGIKVEVTGAILAGINKETASKLTVKLTETKAGALAKLYHFLLVIKADTSKDQPVAGVSLNENQYIKLALKARIEGGITIDLDE